MPLSAIPDDLPHQVRCQQDERRAQPRLRCKGTAEVRILHLGTTIAGTIDDLSAGGCCVLTEARFPPLEQPVVEVILTVNSSTLRVAGVIRNVQKERRAGIEFVDVTRRKAEQILELVEELKERKHGCAAQLEDGADGAVR
jgi:c-di-GMP-binding flagellar brake protein YcgR